MMRSRLLPIWITLLLPTPSALASGGSEWLYGVQNSIGTNDAGVAVVTDALVLIDRGTGEGTILGPLVDANGTEYAFVTALAYSNADGVFFGIDDFRKTLLRVSPNDGSVTGVTPLVAAGVPGLNGASVIIASLSYDPDSGMLVGVDTVPAQLVTINPTTGLVASVTGFPGSLRQPGQSNVIVTSAAVEPGGDLAFFDTLSDEIYRVSLDPDAGTPTPLGADFSQTPFPSLVTVAGLAAEPETGVLFGTETGGVNVLFSFEPGGVPTPILALQDSGIGSDLAVDGLAFAPHPGCNPADVATQAHEVGSHARNLIGDCIRKF